MHILACGIGGEDSQLLIHLSLSASVKSGISGGAVFGVRRKATVFAPVLWGVVIDSVLGKRKKSAKLPLK